MRIDLELLEPTLILAGIDMTPLDKFGREECLDALKQQVIHNLYQLDCKDVPFNNISIDILAGSDAICITGKNPYTKYLLRHLLSGVLLKDF